MEAGIHAAINNDMTNHTFEIEEMLGQIEQSCYLYKDGGQWHSTTKVSITKPQTESFTNTADVISYCCNNYDLELGTMMMKDDNLKRLFQSQARKFEILIQNGCRVRKDDGSITRATVAQIKAIIT